MDTALQREIPRSIISQMKRVLYISAPELGYPSRGISSMFRSTWSTAADTGDARCGTCSAVQCTALGRTVLSS